MARRSPPAAAAPAAAPTPSPAAPDREAAIQARVAAGLTRDQAEEVQANQEAHDRTLAAQAQA